MLDQAHFAERALPANETRRGGTQARGRARRRKLLDSARHLLNQADMDHIGMADVAAQAGVPKSSAYHFYPGIYDLYADLSFNIATEILTMIEQPLARRHDGWQSVIAELIQRGADFYAADAAATQLLIGPKTPPDIKRRDRNADVMLGEAFSRHLCSTFKLDPDATHTPLLFRAVEIADLMFMLSVLEHGRVMPFYAREAARAALAYLELYIPRYLEPRD